MPRYDMQCDACGRVRTDVWVSNWRDANGVIDIAPCECGFATMRWNKLPSAPNFSVKGYNAANGYGRKE